MLNCPYLFQLQTLSTILFFPHYYFYSLPRIQGHPSICYLVVCALKRQAFHNPISTLKPPSNYSGALQRYLHYRPPLKKTEASQPDTQPRLHNTVQECVVAATFKSEHLQHRVDSRSRVSLIAITTSSGNPSSGRKFFVLLFPCSCSFIFIHFQHLHYRFRISQQIRRHLLVPLVRRPPSSTPLRHTNRDSQASVYLLNLCHRIKSPEATVRIAVRSKLLWRG